MIGIKLGINDAIATEGGVAEFTDEIEGHARCAQPVLQQLAPTTSISMREAGGLPVNLREIGAARDAVAEREDAQRLGG